jgi:integrase
MEWREINWDAAIWTVPGSRMKTYEDHRVPLCPYLIGLLRSQQKYAGGSPYVFPGRGRRDRHIHPRALLHLLHDTMGERCTVHDFRRSFRNWGFKTFRGDGDRELLEMCLAHKIKNKVEGAYMTEDGLDERRPIMNAWSAFCNGR